MSGPTRLEGAETPLRPADTLFRPADGGYEPTDLATGPWHAERLHGGAVAALAAHAAAAELGPERPLARICVDFLGPVPAAPLRVDVRPVRSGRSFAAVDVTITADGTPVATAGVLGIRRAATDLPPGLPGEPAAPPRDGGWALADPSDRPSFNRDATETVLVDDPDNPLGATAWARLRTTVAGEPGAPEQAAIALADLTHGIGAILPPDLYRWTNLDLTVHLIRPPVGEWIALRARTRPGVLGRGVAEAVLIDTAGEFGTAAQTLLITKE
ncbi:thioesterase family protein [Streptomyces sp. NPDC006798]|uniref:thioesterase family protein n=1 Tax=Streptomyces sp. NPDC006798 TaxID=3155462 RepID=UPI0033CFE06A